MAFASERKEIASVETDTLGRILMDAKEINTSVWCRFEYNKTFWGSDFHMKVSYCSPEVIDVRLLFIQHFHHRFKPAAQPSLPLIFDVKLISPEQLFRPQEGRTRTRLQ
jgi:hypothetical protein